MIFKKYVWQNSKTGQYYDVLDTDANNCTITLLERVPGANPLTLDIQDFVEGPYLATFADAMK